MACIILITRNHFVKQAPHHVHSITEMALQRVLVACLWPAAHNLTHPTANSQFMAFLFSGAHLMYLQGLDMRVLFFSFLASIHRVPALGG